MTSEAKRWTVTILKSDNNYVAFDYKRNPKYYLTPLFKEALIFAGHDDEDAALDTAKDVQVDLGLVVDIVDVPVLMYREEVK